MNCDGARHHDMELLAMFATDEQTEHWLKPLLDAAIRSPCFSMTEFDVAASDAVHRR